METIEINGKSYLIDTEKAIEQGLLKEKDNKPHSWEEYDRALKHIYVTSGYDEVGVGGTRYDHFATETEAKAFCALGKLIQLRDAWWGEWQPDWESNSVKYGIVMSQNTIIVGDGYIVSKTFVFPTYEIAADFLNTFRDLIEQAKMFL